MTRCVCGLAATLTFPGLAAEEKLANTRRPELTEMTLEELGNIRVTIASKKEEKLFDVAAAISVITQDELRRSGVTSIPEALRLVPGVQVGRVDSHTWAISARGFNDTFANKLLVLQDGRSIYTPLFSGVFWDAEDTLLEDIDRIEVVRGPGATLWGANAVNGVVNIITKSAKETQGTLLLGGGGTEETVFGGVRYGGRLGEGIYYRVYGKYFNRDDSVLPNGADANDHWHMGRGGFRIDWETDAATNNLITFQGDFYRGTLDATYIVASPDPPYSQTILDDNQVRGGNLLGRWTHGFSDTSDLKLQVYYDRTERQTAIFNEDRDSYDVDLQHRFAIGEFQDVVWGGGYRLSEDRVGNTFSVSLNPDHRTTQVFSSFVQDEITLWRDRLKVTIGSKFEHNDFTGFEIQPSARLSWTPRPRHTLWASVARAVRTPSRAEDDLRLNQQVFPPGAFGPGTPTTVASIFGSRNFGSEQLLAYEIGYRVQPHDRFTLDVSCFYHDYDELRSIETRLPYFELSPPPPHLVVPLVADNKLYGEAYGAEAAVNFQVIPNRWRLQATYSYLNLQLHQDPGSTSSTSEADERRSPRQQFTLRSSLDLTQNLQWDCTLRYVDSLPAIQVPRYLVLDVRLGWRPVKNLELAVVAQNLLDNHHPEFKPSFIVAPALEVEHSVYGKITWQF